MISLFLINLKEIVDIYANMCYYIYVIKERKDYKTQVELKKEEIIMKLKDLFKMVESQNKFAEFMSDGYKELQVVKVNGREIDGEFTKAKDLVNEINECYYANIDENIEIVNNKGFIEMTFEQEIPNFKVVDGFVQKFIDREEKTLSIYIDTNQIWG